MENSLPRNIRKYYNEFVKTVKIFSIFEKNRQMPGTPNSSNAWIAEVLTVRIMPRLSLKDFGRALKRFVGKKHRGIVNLMVK